MGDKKNTITMRHEDKQKGTHLNWNGPPSEIMGLEAIALNECHPRPGQPKLAQFQLSFIVSIVRGQLQIKKQVTFKSPIEPVSQYN